MTIKEIIIKLPATMVEEYNKLSTPVPIRDWVKSTLWNQLNRDFDMRKFEQINNDDPEQTT